MTGWEVVANNRKKTGFSVGWVSVLDDYGRTVWTVDAHRDGKRFNVRADEILTAFVEVQRAIRAFAWMRSCKLSQLSKNARALVRLYHAASFINGNDG